MANLKNEMGSAGELRVPRGLFAALDKKKETSLDGFERQLMKDAVEKGDDIRRRAKLRQVQSPPRFCCQFDLRRSIGLVSVFFRRIWRYGCKRRSIKWPNDSFVCRKAL
jgi:hypothetical protein